MKTPKVTARAHTNIALVKYWGKADEELIIPQNNSLSLTLDHFYTDTTVQFDPTLTADQFTLNGQAQKTTKITQFLDIIRQMAASQLFARVESTNHVPTMAGLASSASAYAALALAGSKALGLDLNSKDLSRLARRGSGSACRSIYGGFVEWQKGDSDQTSYAVPLVENLDWDLKMIAIVVNDKQKKIASRAGMQNVVHTSPYYSAWVKRSKEDLLALKQAIAEKDFTQLGKIAEGNAMCMHALNLSATPHFNYFEAESLKAMQLVEQLRGQGLECYYTMDAGPNVKVICQGKDLKAIVDSLSQEFSNEQLLVASAGPGAEILEIKNSERN